MFSDYRTPSIIRLFTKLGIVLTPILLIPSWAHIAKDTPAQSDWLVYVCAFVLPLMFMALSNAQNRLENPFQTEMDGPDGIRVDALQMVGYMSDMKWAKMEGSEGADEDDDSDAEEECMPLDFDPLHHHFEDFLTINGPSVDFTDNVLDLIHEALSR